MTGTDKELDIVLFGASGFVGRLTAAYLAGTAPDGVRVGLAGRSLRRVEEVRAGLGERAAAWPLLCVDSADQATLCRMAANAEVVASVVGPYARHGLPLVKVCAETGTHYADITGEVTFVRRSIDAAHEAARASAARIVHACGFDAVPSDLAALALAERARCDGAGGLTRTQLALVSARGGVSGGTIDSLRTLVHDVGADPAVAAMVRDPYALSPDPAGEPDAAPGSRRSRLPRRDPVSREWTAPYAMAPFNTRIVRRSNALSGWSYGRGFRYSEVVGCGSGPLAPLAAGAVTLGTAALVAGLRSRTTRKVVDRLLPAPGSGPDEQRRKSGFFRMRARAGTEGGGEYVAHVAASGDPGYTATAVMLGESVLSLALDPRDGEGGVLTPATALGGRLGDRLRSAGFELRVEALP